LTGISAIQAPFGRRRNANVFSSHGDVQRWSVLFRESPEVYRGSGPKRIPFDPGRTVGAARRGLLGADAEISGCSEQEDVRHREGSNGRVDDHGLEPLM